METTHLKIETLPRDKDTREFEGYLYGNARISLILADLPSGEGPHLHSHPYEEVFIILEGQAAYTIGSDGLEIEAGQIVIVPAGTPHKFINTGRKRLKQIDIHVNRKFITRWPEDESRDHGEPDAK